MDSTARGIRAVTDHSRREDTQEGRRSSSADRAAGSDASAAETRHGVRNRARAGDMVPPSDRTQLGARRTAETSPEIAAPPNHTQLGRRGAGELHPQSGGSASASPTADDGVARFGPGVPHGAATPTWTPAGAPRRRTRRRGALGSLLTAIVVAAALWFLLPSGESLRVQALRVAPAAEPGRACDVTVDVVGTVATNGRPGTITYQWQRNDGQTSAVLSQTVPEGTSVAEVHLMWTLSGTGTYPAQATLRVLAPDASEAVGGFTYRC